jgi:predicted esterase
MKSAFAWFTGLALLGCAAGSRERVVGSALAPDSKSQDTAPAAPASPASPASPRGTVSLAVPGFDPAVVSFPPSARPPQPVIVVAHGAKDLPDAQCRQWRAIVGDRTVLVCLSGPRADVKTEPRYFPDHRVLEQILVATLAALRTAYPSAVDPHDAIYAGYSQGATMGALMIGAHAADFPRLALVEGGFEEWTVPGAAAFKSGGGCRVLFACGTRRCQEHATTSAKVLRSAGVEARVVADPSEGHAYGPAMAKLVQGAFDWLVADDPRFSRDGR